METAKMIDLILQQMDKAPDVPGDFVERWAAETGSDLKTVKAALSFSGGDLVGVECRRAWAAEFAGMSLSLAAHVSEQLHSSTSKQDEDII